MRRVLNIGTLLGFVAGVIVGVYVIAKIKMPAIAQISVWLTKNDSLVKVIGAILGGWLVLYQLSRNNLAKNTVAERREWRKKLRTIAEKQTFDEADYQVIWANINPFQGEDDKLKTALKDTNKPDEIRKELYRLLKLDWERSKAETSVFSWFVKQWIDKVKYKNKTISNLHDK